MADFPKKYIHQTWVSHFNHDQTWKRPRPNTKLAFGTLPSDSEFMNRQKCHQDQNFISSPCTRPSLAWEHFSGPQHLSSQRLHVSLDQLTLPGAHHNSKYHWRLFFEEHLWLYSLPGHFVHSTKMFPRIRLPRRAALLGMKGPFQDYSGWR